MCRTEFTKYEQCGHTVTQAFYCLEQLNAREAAKSKGKGKGKGATLLGGGHCVKKDLPCEDPGLCPSCLAKQSETDSGAIKNVEEAEEDDEQQKPLPTGSLRGRAKTFVTAVKEAVGEKKRRSSNNTKKSGKDGHTTPPLGVPRPPISDPILQHSSTFGSSPLPLAPAPPMPSRLPPIPTARFINSRDEHYNAEVTQDPGRWQQPSYFPSGSATFVSPGTSYGESYPVNHHPRPIQPYGQPPLSRPTGTGMFASSQYAPQAASFGQPRTLYNQSHSNNYPRSTTPYGQLPPGTPTNVGMFQHSFFSLPPADPAESGMLSRPSDLTSSGRSTTPYDHSSFNNTGNPSRFASSQYESHAGSFGQPAIPYGSKGMFEPTAHTPSGPSKYNAAVNADEDHSGSPSSNYGPPYSPLRRRRPLPNAAGINNPGLDPIDIANQYRELIGSHPRQAPVQLRRQEVAQPQLPAGVPRAMTNLGGLMVEDDVLAIHAEIKRRMAEDREKELEARENQF